MQNTRSNSSGHEAPNIHSPDEDEMPTNIDDAYIQNVRNRINNEVDIDLWNCLIDDPAVLDAVDQLTHAETAVYDRVATALNAISAAIVRQCSGLPETGMLKSFGREGMIWWTHGRRQAEAVRGNLMAELTRHMPDYYSAREGGDGHGHGDAYWQEVCSIGEYGTDDLEQLEAHVIRAACYRPDLVTVHGFSIADQKLRLASVNALGFWLSPELPLDDVQGYVAHVCDVYYSDASRIRELTLMKATDEILYTLRLPDREPLAVAPAYYRGPPGPRTFILLRLDLDSEEPARPMKSHTNEELLTAFTTRPSIGVIKIVWKGTNTPCLEYTLYEKAHGDRHDWLPGLARHSTSLRLSEYPVSHPLVPGTLYPEIIQLSTYGDPITDCETVRDLLETAYDMVQAVEDLYDRKIVHRDVSLRNFLYRPFHAVDATPHSKDDKGIAAILRPEMPMEADGKTRVPPRRCVLVDLDHAAELGESPDGTTCVLEPTGAITRTGTGAFMSLELLAATSDVELWSDDFPSLDELLFLRPSAHALSHPSTAACWERAFSPAVAEKYGYEGPRAELYDDERLSVLLGRASKWMRQRIRETDGTLQCLGPRPHRLRYDVESCFWVLYWICARLLPQDQPTPDHSSSTAYVSFVRAMLSQTDRNMTKLDHGISDPLNRFHPTFKPLQNLIIHIARYLTRAPWQYFEDVENGPDFRLELHETHASVTTRRMILAFLLEPRYQEFLDTKLVTEYPRPCSLRKFVQPGFTYLNATGSSKFIPTVDKPSINDIPSKGLGHDIKVDSAEYQVLQIRKGDMWLGAGVVKEGSKTVSSASRRDSPALSRTRGS